MSSKRPRHRYIAFQLDGPRSFRREEILETLRTSAPRLGLAAFDGTAGLVRTTNVEKEGAIRALVAIEVVAGVKVRVRTLGTSGTIRAATEKYLKTHDRAFRATEKKTYK